MSTTLDRGIPLDRGRTIHFRMKREKRDRGVLSMKHFHRGIHLEVGLSELSMKKEKGNRGVLHELHDPLLDVKSMFVLKCATFGESTIMNWTTIVVEEELDFGKRCDDFEYLSRCIDRVHGI